MTEEDRARFYEILGNKICRLRRDGQISQEALAKKLSLSRVSIVNIEKGRQRPPLHTYWEIAETLGIPLGNIIPTVGEIVDNSGGIELDAETIAQISEAAEHDPATRRRLTDFVQSAKSKITHKPR